MYGFESVGYRLKNTDVEIFNGTKLFFPKAKLLSTHNL
jgi:hypothetical protein